MSTDDFVQLEWGHRGLEAMAAGRVQTLIVVDVLSFSTCVSIAVDHGALIFPYRWVDDGQSAYAQAHGAVLAGTRGETSTGYSLSPASMVGACPGERIVLPSPNGSSLSFEAGRHGTVLAGCLRNRRAVAAFAARTAGPVAVVAAGERWPDGSIRFAIEDLIGAGGIIAMLPHRRSPEAEAAAATFERFQPRLIDALRTCASGRELIDRGFAADVAIAAELDVGDAVPVLVDGCYQTADDRAAGITGSG